MMITRAEKLFNVRAQVQKATAEIEHGDTYASCLALADALGAVLTLLEEEIPKTEALTAMVEELHSPFQYRADERAQIHSVGEKVKEPEQAAAAKETREALDTLRAEPTKIKRR